MMWPRRASIMAGRTARLHRKAARALTPITRSKPLGWGVQHAAPVQGAGIVHQHVDPAETLECLRRQRLDLTLFSNIDLDRERLAAECHDLLLDGVNGAGKLVCRFDALGGQDDVTASPRQAKSDGSTDAPARPGDYGDPTLQCGHWVPHGLGSIRLPFFILQNIHRGQIAVGSVRLQHLAQGASSQGRVGRVEQFAGIFGFGRPVGGPEVACPVSGPSPETRLRSA